MIGLGNIMPIFFVTFHSILFQNIENVHFFQIAVLRSPKRKKKTCTYPCSITTRLLKSPC